MLNFAQSGAGKDIDGTSSTWSVSKAGALTCVSIADSATDATLQVDGNGTGGVTICGTSTGAITLTTATTATVSLTITGSADANAFIIDNGDVLISNGKIALTNDDTDSALAITAASVTTGNVGSITAVGVTTGALWYLSTTEAGMTADIGDYIRCYNSTVGASQFRVSTNGRTTITGNAVGTNSLTITAGDLTMSDGNVAVTSTGTTDVFSITDDSLLANNALIVKGSGAFTGTGASSFVAITPTGATTGTGLYIALAAATTLSYALDITTSTTTGAAARLTNSGILTGVGAALSIIADSATTPGNAAGEGVVNISADGLTLGTVFNVESVSNELMTSGNLADFTHSASGTTVAAKTGTIVNITSSITESGTSTQDYDVLSLTRTSIHDTAGTLTAQGAILKLENVATETGATLTDTVHGIEILMDTQGTGSGVFITHSATGAKAIDVVSAATTVSCVLITSSGVKANNKASLEVTNSGATAAGGSILRVTNNGTPAAATSYLVDFDYSGATMTNNPTTIFVNAGGSTNSVLEINGSGASAASKGMISLLNTNTGATGVVFHSQHTSTGSAAADDAVFTMRLEGLDSGDAVTEYCRFEAEIQVATAGQEDGRFILSAAADNGTLTQMAALNPRAGGALAELVMGSGAGATYLTSNGAYDLVLDTNQGTNAGSITLTDAAAGAITLAPATTGKVVVTPASGVALTTAFEVTVGDMKMGDGVFSPAVSAGVTADVGSAQGGSPITRSIVEIATCVNSGDSVTLPTAVAGRTVIITNHGAQAADVFPASGDAINEGAADTATAIAANETFICYAYDATNWEVCQLARNT